MMTTEEERQQQEELQRVEEEPARQEEEQRRVEEERQKPPPGYVPVRAVQDERLKRQELERQLQEANQRLSQERRPAETPKKKTTVDDVVAAYGEGRITEAEKDRYIAHLVTETAENRAVERFRQESETKAVSEKASTGITQYMERFPQLRDTSSGEFAKVKREYDFLLGMGYDDTDRTQLVAMRTALGPVEDRERRSRAEDISRETSTFSEGGGGGAGVLSDADKNNPLKDIPKEQIEYWQKKGYSEEEMKAEAPYVRRKPTQSGMRWRPS